MKIWTDTQKNIKKDHNLILKPITSRYTGWLQVHHDIKKQMSKSKFQAILIVISNIRAFVHVDFVLHYPTIKQELLKNYLRKELAMDFSAGWRHAYNVLSVCQSQKFFDKYGVPVLDHPLHSPDFAVSEF